MVVYKVQQNHNAADVILYSNNLVAWFMFFDRHEQHGMHTCACTVWYSNVIIKYEMPYKAFGQMAVTA